MDLIQRFNMDGDDEADPLLKDYGLSVPFAYAKLPTGEGTYFFEIHHSRKVWSSTALPLQKHAIQQKQTWPKIA
jgi:hypothetical protein